MKKLHRFLFLFAILFFIVMTAYCLFIKNHYNGDTLENIKNTIHVFYDDLPKNEIQIIDIITIDNYKIAGFYNHNKVGIITFQKQKQHYEFHTITYRNIGNKAINLFSFSYYDIYNNHHDYDILTNFNTHLKYFYRQKNNEPPQKFIVDNIPSMIFINNGKIENGFHITYHFYDETENEI